MGDTDGQRSDQQSEAATDQDDDGQSYVDRDKVDFDPDDGLLSGTAIDGTSEIPGPHEQGDATDTDSPPDSAGDQH